MYYSASELPQKSEDALGDNRDNQAQSSLESISSNLEATGFMIYK